MIYHLKFKCRICGSVFNSKSCLSINDDEVDISINETDPVPGIFQQVAPVWHRCFVGFIPDKGPIGIADIVGLQPIPEPQEPQE